MNQKELGDKVVSMLLAGDHSVLAQLRKQYAESEVAKRDFTGVGFFTEYRVKPGTPPIQPPASGVPRDVGGRVLSPPTTLLFNLFVKKGYIDTLEGIAVENNAKWPKDYSQVTIFYSNNNGQRDYDLEIRGLPHGESTGTVERRAAKIISAIKGILQRILYP